VVLFTAYRFCFMFVILWIFLFACLLLSALLALQCGAGLQAAQPSETAWLL